MHKALWVLGSFLVATIAAAAPATLAYLVVASVEDPGQSGLLIVAGVVWGAPIAYLLSLAVIFGVAALNQARTGRPVVRVAMLGGLLPIAVALSAAVIVVSVQDFQDKTELAESTLADFVAESGPTLPPGTSSSALPWLLTEPARDCAVETRWWAAQSITLDGGGVDAISKIHQHLTDQGWLVRQTRTAGPLDTHEIVVVAAARADVYHDVRAVLSPNTTRLEVLTMVGPCVEENGWDLVQQARSAGQQVEPSFAEPIFAGVDRTQVELTLWAPRPLDTANSDVPTECGQEASFARGNRSQIWASDQNAEHLTFVADPHGDAVLLLAEMQASLESDGWETVFKRQRAAPSESSRRFHGEEVRKLWARNGENMLLLSAAMQITGDGHPFAQVDTTTWHGACIAAVGFELQSPLRFGGRVLEPFKFEALEALDS